ncbi:hypothetical protein BC628DRAFT_1373767 [Trametes gibbosa]|nr:hypothetical protein BC628DRAFT_1373767 [Trametes gibbosa]
MDFETVSLHIKDVRYLIEQNLGLLASNHHELEDVFVHRDLALDQLAALDAVVEDSIVLYGQGSNTNHKFALLQPDFLVAQIKNFHAVVQDIQALQEAGVNSTKLRLQTMGDAFILSVIRSMYSPAIENIDICTVAESQSSALNVHSLKVMQPKFVKMLLRWLLLVAESHVTKNREMSAYAATQTAAQATISTMREEVTSLREAEKAMQTRIAQLDTALSDLQGAKREADAALDSCRREKRQLEDTLKESEAAARAAVDMSRSEMIALRAVNGDCAKMLAERDAQLAQCREHLEARTKEVAALKTPSGPSRGAGTMRLRLLPHVKVPSRTTTRRTRQSEPAVGLRARAVTSRGEGRDDSGDENEDNDEDEDEGDRVPDENTHMEASANTLQAELRDTQVKLEAALQKATRLEVELAFRDQPPGTTTSGVSAEKGTNATTSIPESLTSLNLMAHALLMIPERARELASLPVIPVSIPQEDVGAYKLFTRYAINSALGGSAGGHLVRVTNSATKLAKKHKISSFLCLNMEMSPWLPAGPGRHGFVHADIGKDLELLRDGDTQHVFVGGLGRSSKLQPRYMYCGEYRIVRQAPLTSAEWNTFPLQMQVLHAEIALVRDPNLASKTTEHVLRASDTGELRLNCVRLECIQFDADFYKELVPVGESFDGVPATSSAGAGGSGKRRRHQRDETYTDADVDGN